MQRQETTTGKDQITERKAYFKPQDFAQYKALRDAFGFESLPPPTIYVPGNSSDTTVLCAFSNSKILIADRDREELGLLRKSSYYDPNKHNIEALDVEKFFPVDPYDMLVLRNPPKIHPDTTKNLRIGGLVIVSHYWGNGNGRWFARMNNFELIGLFRTDSPYDENGRPLKHFGGHMTNKLETENLAYLQEKLATDTRDIALDDIDTCVFRKVLPLHGSNSAK